MMMIAENIQRSVFRQCSKQLKSLVNYEKFLYCISRFQNNFNFAITHLSLSPPLNNFFKLLHLNFRQFCSFLRTNSSVKLNLKLILPLKILKNKMKKELKSYVYRLEYLSNTQFSFSIITL